MNITADVPSKLPTPSLTQNLGPSIMVWNGKTQNALISFFSKSSKILKRTTGKKPKHGRLGLCSSGIWKSISDFLRQIQNNLRLRECPLGEILQAVSHSALIGSGLPNKWVITQPFDVLVHRSILPVRHICSLLVHLCTPPGLTLSQSQLLSEH